MKQRCLNAEIFHKPTDSSTEVFFHHMNIRGGAARCRRALLAARLFRA